MHPREETALGCRAPGKIILSGDLLQTAEGNSELGEWFNVLLTFSCPSHLSAPVVKRQMLLMTTNPMMDCSFYGVREASESQNKQGEIKNWGPQQQPKSLQVKKEQHPQPYQEYQQISRTKPSHKGKAYLICSTSVLGHLMIISCLLSSLQALILKAFLSRDQENTQPTSCESAPPWEVQTAAGEDLSTGWNSWVLEITSLCSQVNLLPRIVH